MTRKFFSLINLQRSLRLAAATVIFSLPSLQAQAADEVRRIDSTQSFAQLAERLQAAVAANKMVVVTQASASKGAASRGVSIPGNLVVGVYRNDYAVRMLDASVASGIEAPLRFYLVENADGSTSLSWATPSSTFAPYASAELDEMARELDDVFAAIARDATAK
ncbi:DUF302 domain-containing protein [Marinobacterium rhizophilum]|uniref:DUF302 domain-containing protein n=1 Tax=Marinobacterium rhizophilum TaxID=420402 RepID=A0ABY5HFP5_9GAMM|nr:DUF302 domain-containing protein [Marinobacterium rhizophilum]UTW10144.1 DUF302 domain-containing protein [Marinobacterium rhizophilum]